MSSRCSVGSRSHVIKDEGELGSQSRFPALRFCFWQGLGWHVSQIGTVIWPKLARDRFLIFIYLFWLIILLYFYFYFFSFFYSLPTRIVVCTAELALTSPPLPFLFLCLRTLSVSWSWSRPASRYYTQQYPTTNIVYRV